MREREGFPEEVVLGQDSEESRRARAKALRQVFLAGMGDGELEVTAHGAGG